MSEYESDNEGGGGVNNSGADAVRISDVELVENLQQVADELGRVPTSREMDDHGEYSRGPYRSHFGRWNKALEAAGLKESTDDEEHECPWEGCDYTSNEDGVRRHHKLAHGESIAGVEVVCENCGKVYSEKPHRARSDGRNFHNRACFDEYMAENPLANTEKRLWHDEETVREFYVERDVSARELGDMLGCSTQAILRSLDRFGIEKDLPTWERTPDELKDKDTLHELYVEQRMVAREIAAKLGCSTSTVTRWVNEYDFDSHFGVVEDIRDAETLRRMYVNQKRTVYEMADELDCAVTTVRRWLTHHDIEIRPRKAPATDELTDVTLLREMYIEKGLDAHEVAAKLGCHKQSVLYWLHKHGIETRPRQEPAVSELEEEELMEWLYVDQRKTQREIAAELGCRTGNVGYWLRKHGIETRDGPNTGIESAHWRGGHSTYHAVLALIRDEPWSTTTERIRDRNDHICQMCREERAPTDRALDVHHIPGLMDGGCNADELLTSLCNECHKKAEHYLRTIPEIELVLCDWSDDELPEGRKRWTPDATASSLEKVTFAEFASRAEGEQ